MPQAGNLDFMYEIVAVLNIGAAEMLVIGLVALIVVGPEQLPGLIRRIGRTVAQVRSMTDGIKDEFMATVDENDDLKDLTNVMDPKSWTSGAGTKDDPVVPRNSAAKKKAAETEDSSESKPAEEVTASNDNASDAADD